jgi:hypothetical protein
MRIDAWTAKENLFSRFVSLGRAYYPQDHPLLNERFLSWFYLGNPGGEATMVVAHEDDVWAGVIVLIPVVLMHGGRLQNACYAVNVLTHPKHRGKNLFGQMIQHASSLLSSKNIWLLGHPNANALRGWIRQGMEFRDPLRVHVAKGALSFSSVREVRMERFHQFEEIPDGFWSQVENRADVHVKYTAEFVRWRYLDAPHRKYFVSGVYKGGDFLGLRVTRRFKRGLDLMVDFIGFPGTLHVLLASVRWPTLVVHSGLGSTAADVNKACWKIPFNRQIPFFITTWGQAVSTDMCGITLAASDF